MAGRKPGAHIAEFDVIRGIAIVFVVYLHAYFSPWEVTPNRQEFAMHTIHLFAHTAVPLFLFIAGFLVARDRSPDARVFWRKRALRVALPAAFWMTAALCYRAYDEGGFSSANLGDFVRFNVTGQYYYIVVLLVSYAALFPLRHWPARRVGWLTLGAFVANLATIAWYEQQTISGDFAVLAYRNPLSWAVFPVFGLWVARAEALGKLRRWLPLTLAAMAALLTAYLVQGERFDDYPVSYFGVAVFLFSCLAVAAAPPVTGLLLRGPARLAAAPFRALGRYSFAIYLVHMPFFIGAVTDRYVSESWVKDDFWQLMNAIFIVGFLASLAFVVAVDRLAPWVAMRLMGVERPHIAMEPLRRARPGAR